MRHAKQILLVTICLLGLCPFPPLAIARARMIDDVPHSPRQQPVPAKRFPFVTQASLGAHEDLAELSIEWDSGLAFFPGSEHPLTGPSDWQRTRAQCTLTLVELAKAKQLKHDTLAACIQVALNDKRNERLAVIPVAACLLQRRGATVWVISCIWERRSWLEGDDPPRLTHYRTFAITASTKTAVAFWTCN
jgi:hypothetical protein